MDPAAKNGHGARRKARATRTSTSDADGVRHDHERTPVSYLDNVDGRYVERLDANGMATVRPATRDDLVTELRARQRKLAEQ